MLVTILLSSVKDLETLTGVYTATQDIKIKQNFELKTWNSCLLIGVGEENVLWCPDQPSLSPPPPLLLPLSASPGKKTSVKCWDLAGDIDSPVAVSVYDKDVLF